MRRLLCWPLAAALLIALPGLARALSIDPNTRFTLGNHPDGAAAEPFYGMRIDGVNGDDDDIFTFSFVGNGASMTMDYLVDGTGARLHIFGLAYGGLDGGDAYEDPQLWSIDFTYTDVQQGSGVVLLFAVEGSGSGTLTPLEQTVGAFSPGQSIQLADEAGEHPFSFALELDHRDYDGISGLGWLNHDAIGDLSRHVKIADWLFTAEDPRPVPEPDSLALMCLGFAWIARRTRRQRARR